MALKELLLRVLSTRETGTAAPVTDDNPIQVVDDSLSEKLDEVNATVTQKRWDQLLNFSANDDAPEIALRDYPDNFRFSFHGLRLSGGTDDDLITDIMVFEYENEWKFEVKKISVLNNVAWSKRYNLVDLEDDMAIKTITVTSAQLLDLLANPVELIAAPATGSALWIQSLFYDYQHGGTDYAGTGGQTIISLDGGFSSNSDIDLRELLTKTASQTGMDQYADYADKTLHDGQPLVMSSLTNDLTLGDGDLTITILYRLITLQ